jgi:hypothetical protein
MDKHTGDDMKRITREDYEDLLEAAGDEAEAQAEANLEAETIEARLNALSEGGFQLSEAEQLAAMADAPKERSDGKIVGISEQRARPLTESQIAFAQAVIEGKSKRQAYREAYPNSQAADKTVSAAAARLMKDARIKKMIEDGWEETTEALADDIAATRRYVMRALVALSKGAKQEGSRLKALELLGRTASLFKETQVQSDKPITADQLRKELSMHLRLVGNGKAKGG